MERKIIPLFPKWWPWVALAFVHWIFVRKGHALSKQQLQHERIHLQQQADLWYVGFFLIYILEFLLRLFCNDLNWMRAYRRISFEQEAYALENIVWEELETFRHENYWWAFLRHDLSFYLRTQWWPYAAMVLLVVYISLDQFSRHGRPDPQMATLISKMNEPVVADTVDLLQLHEDYEMNELRANRQYAGRQVFVWGLVDRVSQTVDQQGLVELINDRARAYAYFPPEEKARLIELEKYKPIGVTCRCDGRLLWVVQLKDCRITAW